MVSRSRGMIAGAIGGVAGALMMNQFQRLAARAGNGREAADAPVGLPRSGRGPQPAQALSHPGEDSTALIANAAASAVGRPLTTPREKQVAGEFVHLAFGAINGALYGLAVETDSRARTGYGIPFGIGVWAVADEGIVPALGVSRGPSQQSAGLLAYSFVSHCVYGLTTELVRRAVR